MKLRARALVLLSDGQTEIRNIYRGGQSYVTKRPKIIFAGDKTLLPGYIHSITSTENYVILPITSLLINPCKFKEPPMTNIRSAIQKGGLWGMDFYDMVPMRFPHHLFKIFLASQFKIRLLKIRPAEK